MSTITPVNVGTSPDDNNGDLGRNGFIKINTNIDNLNTDKLEAVDIAGKQDILSEGAFVDGDKTKLDGIETGSTANNTDAFLLDRTNHTGTQEATTVTVDDTNFKVIENTNVQVCLDSVDLALLNGRTTGVRYGGIGTINGGDNTQVDFTECGWQTLNNTTPETPLYYKGTLTAGTVQIIVANTVTWVYIDTAGAIQTQTTEPTNTERRTKNILFRAISNGSAVVGIGQEAVSIQQDTQQLTDFMRAVGAVKSGLEVVPNANLTIQRTSGVMTVANENRANSPTNVHDITFNAQNPTTFNTTKQDAAIGTGITNIPVDQYDNGGTLTNLGTNKWSTHRIYQFSSGNIGFQYGQYSYNSLDLAKEGINDAYNEFLSSGILLAYLMIKEGTTDLTDSNSFIQNTNKFGGVGGGLSGGSLTGALLIANNLSDLGDVTTAKTNLALENVDNTSDTTKDAATATLTNKTLTSPVINTPTGIVKSDVGLANVDNTSDVNKPVSTLQQAEIDTKEDSFTKNTAFNKDFGTTAGTVLEGDTVIGDVTLTGTQTLINKRITERTNTITSSATPTPVGDTTDDFTVTALAVGATFAAPTGTPTEGQKLIIRIKDNGTARTLAWNSIYRAGDTALPITTVLSKTMYLGFMYNNTDSKWDLLAYNDNF